MDSLHSRLYEFCKWCNVARISKRNLCTGATGVQGGSDSTANLKLGHAREARRSRSGLTRVDAQVSDSPVEDACYRADYLAHIGIHVLHLWFGVCSLGGVSICFPDSVRDELGSEWFTLHWFDHWPVIGLRICCLSTFRLLKEAGGEQLCCHPGMEAEPSHNWWPRVCDWRFLVSSVSAELVRSIDRLRFGWTSFANIHWMVPTAAGVFIGFGVLCIFLPCFNYLVDSYLPM